MNTIKITILVALCLLFTACESLLDEPIYSQLSPDNLLTTEEGIRNVLYSAYAEAANMNQANSKAEIAREEWPTDMMWQTGAVRTPQPYNSLTLHGIPD